MTWTHFCQSYLHSAELDFSIDYSRIALKDDFLKGFEPRFKAAHQHMKALEKGDISNPDENRMVGHYWLRNAELAPTDQIQKDITDAKSSVLTFSKKVVSGKIKGKGGKFLNLLLVGIGGSALGPQFIEQALRSEKTKGLSAHFLDNTDPDGIDRVLAGLKSQLDQTLVVVISKSGGTKETRNGMLEVQAAYKKAKVPFAPHAVAVTGEGSNLDQVAASEGWLKTFPMWDWVGGRTSVMSAVGLLPAALLGFDIEAFLKGAAEMDAWTRSPALKKNPAALLSAMWYATGGGKGKKDMVLLPYKDRLELFSKYLQQLVMESLGKEKSLSGRKVHQGIAVYGNKGSTDQHAYVQQLRDGLNNFFVTFIEVRKARQGSSTIVEGDATTGDFLEGFLLGTREALTESGRENLTLTIGEVNARSVGQLIALFERAVGYYAHYVNINAYHQPGVEAGKKAAALILELKTKVLGVLGDSKGALAAPAIAKKIGEPQSAEMVFKLLNVLCANPSSKVVCEKEAGPKSTYFKK